MTLLVSLVSSSLLVSFAKLTISTCSPSLLIRYDWKGKRCHALRFQRHFLCSADYSNEGCLRSKRCHASLSSSLPVRPSFFLSRDSALATPHERLLIRNFGLQHLRSASCYALDPLQWRNHGRHPQIRSPRRSRTHPEPQDHSSLRRSSNRTRNRQTPYRRQIRPLKLTLHALRCCTSQRRLTTSCREEVEEQDEGGSRLGND